MLKKLQIEQFVIIDKLELDFQTGLTILTGETGAGKSILIDAMGLILGDASDPKAIRTGADQALIQALFAPPIHHPVWKHLSQQGLVEHSQQDFWIRRIIKASGPEEVLIGDKPVDLEFLKKLGTFMVEIHGQFANQSLQEHATQQTLLDLSGNFPPEVFKNVAEALREVHRIEKALADEHEYLSKFRNDIPKTEKIVKAFDSVGMKAGFVEECQKEYARLLTAKETSEAFQSILGQFVAANGIIVALSSANQILANQENVDTDKIANLTQYLAGSLENARAAVQEMRMLSPEYEIDTAPLYRLEEILMVFHKISKENKVDFPNLFAFYEQMSTKLNRLRNGRQKIEELEDELKWAKNDYRDHASVLTKYRTEAAVVLASKVTPELAPLRLLKAEFQVLVEEKPEKPWTELGLNQITFLARMNPGMPFSSIAQTASGGELARLILALKVVLQKVQTTPTLVFDEVDTGIGGAAAAAVGERLAQLAEIAQVLVITHSPQVASRGNVHLHVSKSTDGVSTTSVVRTLTQEERVGEISNMLAGDAVTEESRAAAKSLLGEARKAAEVRADLVQKKLVEEKERERLEAEAKAQAAAQPQPAPAAAPVPDQAASGQ